LLARELRFQALSIISEFDPRSQAAQAAGGGGPHASKRLKHVLLIAYYFPPSVDVGAKRAEGFFRHLPEYGYRPIVLTVKDGNYVTIPGSAVEERPDVVRVVERRWPARLRSRTGTVRLEFPLQQGRVGRALKRCFREIFYLPDAYRGFYRPARQRALAIIGQQPIDVILTMSGPYTLLRVGYELSLRTGIPWVADFRDLWVENHFGYPQSPVRRFLDSHLQARWLSVASRITTATQGLKARLQASGYGSKPIDCVYNGYLDAPPETSPDEYGADPERFRICFTGKLYEHPTYTVAPFFEALALVRTNWPRAFQGLRVEFYGIVNTDFSVQLERFGLRDVVHFHGMVSRGEAVRAQAAADVLFLPIPDTQEQEVSVYSKTFEYMAARKPILAIVPEAGEAARVLRMAGMGRVFSSHETGKMAEYLSELRSTKQRLGRLPPQGDPRVIETFSYKRLAGGLAEVFDAAIRNGAGTAATASDEVPGVHRGRDEALPGCENSNTNRGAQ